jgi:hypothetical protein
MANVRDTAPEVSQNMSASRPTPTVETVAAQYAAEIVESAIEPVLRVYEERRQLPPDVDRPLLGKAKNLLGILNSEQKRLLRDAFAAELRRRQGQ